MIKGKGKSICLFSSKGGTGKSLTAINIAGFFATQGKKVLIVDYDLYFGSIGLYLNKDYTKTLLNFASDYVDNKSISLDNYVTKYNDNIYFLPSAKDPRSASKVNSKLIDLIIEKSIFYYDYLIIDTMSVLNENNVEVLDSVDLNLFIMNNDLVNIKNMHNLLTIFDSADKKNYKILLNESINPYKNYFSLYDIKKMLGYNIDYHLDSKFFIKNIDSYIFDGKIITLDKKFSKNYPKTYKVFDSLLKYMEDENE